MNTDVASRPREGGAGMNTETIRRPREVVRR